MLYDDMAPLDADVRDTYWAHFCTWLDTNDYHTLVKEYDEVSEKPSEVYVFTYDADSGVITPETVQRFVVLQADGAEFYIDQAPTLADLKTHLPHWLTANDEWQVIAVLDLATGREVDYSVQVDILDPTA